MNQFFNIQVAVDVVINVKGVHLSKTIHTKAGRYPGMLLGKDSFSETLMMILIKFQF